MGCREGIEPSYGDSQSPVLTTRLTTQGSRWNQTTDEKGMNLLFYHWTILPRRKMKDSNLRRGFSPRRFSKPLLSATQPIFQVGRRWNRTTIAKGRNRTVSNTVVLTIQGALPSGNNWTWTSGLSIISRMLYQLSYVSKVWEAGFEPATWAFQTPSSTKLSYSQIYS